MDEKEDSPADLAPEPDVTQSSPLTFNMMLLMIGMMILTNCMSMYQTSQLTGTMNKVLIDLSSQQQQLQIELLKFQTIAL